MLRTVIEHAGFKLLYDSAVTGVAAASKAETLATVPFEICHFDLESLFDRPVQAQLVELLLLTSDDPRWSSCVLVHGMGGTGKTVTTVAG